MRPVPAWHSPLVDILPYLEYLARCDGGRDWEERYAWYCLWATEVFASGKSVWHLKAYLRTTTRNRWADRFKGRRVNLVPLADDPATDDPGFQRVDDEDEVRAMFAHLSDMTRRVLIMRYMFGCTHAETAMVLGIGTDQVNVRAQAGIAFARTLGGQPC